ncbi:recombinase family protein [Komagataeibacter oboediens]|uniref:recombinase family protein n=1 Tax=Komagataeibacter oboediens TaxID=65958 RepID=UPI0023DBBDDC|nr:recombinase family protein [Komagataeibacter oboediens]WEQ51759.1 recombinase family protein [Komagataeibacter oboediens]
MMLIGYARENAEEATLLQQVEALRKAGCKKIYEEKVPTMSRDWPILGDVLTELSSDDTLIVYSLDRLAWSTPHLEGSKNRWLMRLARDFRVLAI